MSKSPPALQVASAVALSHTLAHLSPCPYAAEPISRIVDAVRQLLECEGFVEEDEETDLVAELLHLLPHLLPLLQQCARLHPRTIADSYLNDLLDLLLGWSLEASLEDKHR